VAETTLEPQSFKIGLASHPQMAQGVATTTLVFFFFFLIFFFHKNMGNLGKKKKKDKISHETQVVDFPSTQTTMSNGLFELKIFETSG
jgi:hypothetical protein